MDRILLWRCKVILNQSGITNGISYTFMLRGDYTFIRDFLFNVQVLYLQSYYMGLAYSITFFHSIYEHGFFICMGLTYSFTF